MKIILPGGAGLVGQNLVVKLLSDPDNQIVVLDKNTHNLALLEEMHPGVRCVSADLSEAGSWSSEFIDADGVVILNAQIGSPTEGPFIANNIVATENVLTAIEEHCPQARIVHISSSVVNSIVDDLYVRTKTQQEQIVLARKPEAVVLRPTLMFGWFDRKHLGWLSRFLQKVPLFPIPGDGRYVRQPLYAADFCGIILTCLKDDGVSGVFNISGQERVFYVDLIKAIRKAVRSRSVIVHIPYSLFAFLLRTYALFDRDPPFTVSQLEALVAPDEFEVIDWPAIFGVPSTPLADALHETFQHPTYSQIALKF